jgi:hypothetical protein
LPAQARRSIGQRLLVELLEWYELVLNHHQIFQERPDRGQYLPMSSRIAAKIDGEPTLRVYAAVNLVSVKGS